MSGFKRNLTLAQNSTNSMRSLLNAQSTTILSGELQQGL